MKKQNNLHFVSFLLFVLCLLICVSCDHPGSGTETSNCDYSGSMIATSGCELTTSGTDEEVKPISEYKVMGGEFKTKYPFERFFVFNDSKSIYRERKKISTFVSNEAATIRVTVTGFLPERMIDNDPIKTDETTDKDYIERVNLGSYYSYFKVKTVDFFQYDTKYTLNSEYMIFYMGNPRVQTYRLAMPDIGEDYLLLNTAYNEALPEEIDMAMWFKIKKIDGVEYVYPYFVDCSELKNNIPITDPAEAQIYDDPVIISYMDKNNIAHPKFEFKFELNDFIAQIRAMRGLK